MVKTGVQRKVWVKTAESNTRMRNTELVPGLDTAKGTCVKTEFKRDLGSERKASVGGRCGSRRPSPSGVYAGFYSSLHLLASNSQLR